MRPGHFVALVLVAAPVAAFAGSPPSPPNRWTNRVSNAPRGGADTSCEAATSEADLSAVLGENAALLDEDEGYAPLVAELLALGQEHLFEGWPAPGEADDRKRDLLAALARCEEQYPGGLRSYVSKARALLAESAAGENPFEGWKPSVPEGEVLTYGDAAFAAAEEAGAAAAGEAAFVVVAGGLGERLGYEGIKLSLPSEVTTGASYLQLYVEYLLALQARARAASGDETLVVPLAIMTSDDTDAATRALLAAHANFGAAEGQITFIKQEKVPALADSDARLAVKAHESGVAALEMKPHGHGDVHVLLAQSGLAEKWLADGKKWLVFFQDTNSLFLNSVLPALGVSSRQGFTMNSICVPRKAGEAAGAITKLVHDDGRTMTINVEYNQLDPLLKASSAEGGDVNDAATGFSPYPGNANNLVLALDAYVETLNGKDAGVVDEFVNPKYKDESRTAFKKPTRLECMMQDFPKLLAKELDAPKIGFTTFERWLSFSPAKNALDAGKDLCAKGDPPSTASSAEFDVYAMHARRLAASSGAAVEGALARDDRAPNADGDEEYAGVTLAPTARVVLKPSFAVTAAEIAAKVPGGEKVRVSARSTLVLDGAGIELRDVEVDGALVVRACEGAKIVVDGLRVSNDGDALVALADGEGTPEEQIRGYRLERKGVFEVVADTPGNYVIGEDMALVRTV